MSSHTRQKNKISKSDSIGVIRRLARYLRPYRWRMALAFLTAALTVICTLMIPVIIGYAIDAAVDASHVDMPQIASAALAVIAVSLGASLNQWLTSYINSMITSRTVRDLRRKFFDKLMRVPVSYIDQTSHGDIVSRGSQDADVVADGLLQVITQLFSGVATIAGTLIFMLSVNRYITLAVVLLTPLSMLCAWIIARGSYRYFSEQSALQGELAALTNEVISNHASVSAFQYSEQAQERFDAINQRLAVCGRRAQFYSALTNPTTRFVNGLVYAAAALMGSLAAASGSFSIGSITVFLSYANQYTKPFNEISGIVAQLQSALASAQRLFAVIDQPSEDEGGAHAVSGGIRGEVSAENVSFSYVKSKKLIENLNFHAEPGKRIAIVGPTGCGKTTIINLLMRFYDVNAGKITLDGTDIREYRRQDLRKQFSMVLQDTWLFHGTIRDNIAFGRPDASDEEIETAARRAHAHGFITRLPQGYQTMVSGDGGGLSQGQMQLLCIARAMLEDAPMLILDEATSNIDTRTEIAVQKAFTDMMQGKTCFVIAHRLSTIQSADTILVMKDGQLIESGTHDELIALGGFYSKMYQASVSG